MDREDRVKLIYNDCWKNYKQYLEDKDMSGYNDRSEALVEKYGKCTEIINLLMWFAPIVNGIHQDYMYGGK